MDVKKIKVDTSRFGTQDVIEVNKIRITPAKCALDLGDGSERGEYVNQDYIINKLGRPHRNIGLMYTYYPNDKEWPARSSEAYPDMEVHGQWDYPYDDYFVYEGGLGGNRSGQPFEQMRDVRRHGQDVALTLTIDCNATDEQLTAIARDLRTFGRIRVRINHECAGTWFTHNRRFSYKEIGDFFVRFNDIIKKEAPNAETVFCSGFVGEDGKMEKEDDFLKAFQACNVWSGDKYLALHFGWPFDICEKGDPTYGVNPLDGYIKTMDKTVKRLREICGGEKKPFTASEFNTDGDVTGPRLQGLGLLKFADYLRNEKPDWNYSMSMYQFRDRGRLGLEMEDPNNPDVGIEQPLMDDYKALLNDPYFQPGQTVLQTLYSIDSTKKAVKNDISKLKNVQLRWGGAEDSDGIEYKIKLKQKPVFFDVELPEEMNLMFSVNGIWFYKKPGVKVIDAMPAFFRKDAKQVYAGDEISVTFFAPPANGENPETDKEDWAVNYYTEMKTLPKFRIRYDACDTAD
ncbi:MAG: hypothetical protein K6C35_03350 [Eubacterium sp.]|nr:hypothetical protein [Eubacterium sp.]